MNVIKIKRLFSFLIFFNLHLNLNADTISLKNGQKVEGKITNQTREKVELQKDDGTKIIINKDNILKIEFGPTQKEIEEQKRIEEELRKKKEEEQKRIEEELRKKKEEEQKRIEEELRKKKEEKQKHIQIKNRPLEKSHGLEIGYGTGPAYIVPSFFKVYDLFFNGINNLNRNSIISINYNYDSSNKQYYLKYFKNDVEIGILVNLFQLDSTNFKDILRVESGFQGYQYQYSLYNLNRVNVAQYNMFNFWINYNLTQFQVFNQNIIIGLETNIYSNKTNIKQNFLSFNQFLTRYDLIDYNTKNDSKILIGPNLKINTNSKNQYTLSLLLSTGKTEPIFNYIKINSTTTNYLVNSYEIYTTQIRDMKSRGIYFSLQWDRMLYNDFNIFIKYFFNENRYNIKKINGIYFNITYNTLYSAIPPISYNKFIPEFLWDVITIGQKKKAIEKNQYLNIGISYRFTFL